MLDLNNKKRLMCFGLLGMALQAHAEVLVILPESGMMARAGNSIKLGIVSAYEASGSKIPLKFVNSDQKNIQDILKKNVNRNTQMIIGPLARTEVESLLQTPLKVPVLTLNEVAQKKPNVWQYSLSKDEDTTALLNVIKKDNIEKIYVLRQAGTENESLTFVNALFKKFSGDVKVVDTLPDLKKKDGLLLLGNNAWINQFKKLPTKYIYAQAISIEEGQPVPKGLKFCDVPALYQKKWVDVTQLKQKNPTTMAYQRLYAFGGDAWQIAERFVLNPNTHSLNLEGRTGRIKITEHSVERSPQCYESTRKGIVAL